MKFTRIISALGFAAAAAATPAFAAIGVEDQQTELFAVLWDENVGSFTVDLGVTLDAFVAAANTPGYSISSTVGPAYQQFLAADTNPNDGTKFEGTRWAIFAADFQSFGDPGEADGYRYLTTAFGTDKPSIVNSELQQGVGVVGFKALDISQTGANPVTVSANDQTFNPIGGPGVFNEYNNSFTNTGVFAGNVKNNPAKLYYYYTSSYDPFEASTRISFDGVANFDGTSFSYTVAAIPEPSSYALLLAGLLTVGFVARRRS